MGQTGVLWRRTCTLALLATAALGLGVGLLRAANPNEREVEPAPNAGDPGVINKPDSLVWVLNFRFKDPRIITVDVPGRGRRVCWYMWYQVINRTGEPRRLIPDFELVTLDKNTVHRDQVLPKVEEAIRQLEDPANYLKMKNSVTIAAEPIPVTKPESTPRAVTGVAIWDDVDPDTKSFNIFVSGLSNGWSVTDPVAPNTAPVVRRKTLRLHFERVGDRYSQDSSQIHFVPPAEWMYRGSTLTIPGLPGKTAKPEEEKPNGQ